MANEVFANGREISCKSGDGKVIAATPDVCFTPPENPATPPGVPVPYPISSFSSDDAEGTKKVQINGKEIMLRNISYFKKCTGDEAGAAAKKGMITSSNTSKTYFKSWSMDVKFEGENVVRHLDITTSNHRSEVANASVPQVETEGQATATSEEACKKQKDEADSACKGKTPDKCDETCQSAQKCQLVPYKDSKDKCCKESNTGDHIVEASSFYDKGRGGSGSKALDGCAGYSTNEAPCCCVSGGAYSGEHGQMSTLRGAGAQQCPVAPLNLSKGGAPLTDKRVTTYGEAKKRAAKALILVFPQCKEECILGQFVEFDKSHGLNDDTKIKATTYGDPDKWAGIHKIKEALATLRKLLEKTGTGGAAV